MEVVSCWRRRWSNRFAIYIIPFLNREKNEN